MSWQFERHHDPYLAYDRYQFPGFDAYPYLAMAERPAVFTVAPWGYRVLTPWTVHALTERNRVRGFRRLSAAALTGAATLLFLYLVRLGNPPPLALAGAVLFSVSRPVSEVAAYPFLVEPLTVLLEVGLLLALRGGAPAGVLAVVAVLGVLSKEFFVLLLPLVYLERRRHAGSRAAAVDSLLVAVPALAAVIGLRRLWVPHIAPPLPALGWESLATAAARVAESWPDWRVPLLLGGLLPLALVGSLVPAGRSLRASAAWLAAATLLPPFLNPVAFFASDIPRLLLYLLPVCVALALAAVRAGWSRPLDAAPVPASPGLPGGGHRLWLAAAVLLAVAPLVVVDPYRRADLTGKRDGPLVLATCRETLRTAARLDRGLSVTFDPAARTFQWGVSDPADLGRMRWFLRRGFGAAAHYGTGAVVVHEPEAVVLLPLLVPRPMRATLGLEASAPNRVDVLANGVRVHRQGVERGANTVTAAIDGQRLFRGDNEIALRVADAGSPIRLTLVAYEPWP